jgi:hypothetical protein
MTKRNAETNDTTAFEKALDRLRLTAVDYGETIPVREAKEQAADPMWDAYYECVRLYLQARRGDGEA